MKLGKLKRPKGASAASPVSPSGLAKWESLAVQDAVAASSASGGGEGGSPSSLAARSGSGDKKSNSSGSIVSSPDHSKLRRNTESSLSTPQRPSAPSGLLARFNKSGGGGGSLKKSSNHTSNVKNDVEAEEKRRHQAQLAALESFKEKGTAALPSILTAAEGDVPQKLGETREREQGGERRARDVLFEIVDGKPQLRAGTIEEIVKWLIFGGVSEHVSAFLISFRAYGTPAQLWNALMKVFDIVCEKERMSTMTKAELRKKTLDLLLEWIRRFSYKDFTEKGDKTLFKKMTKFVKSLPPEEANQFKILFMRKRDDSPLVQRNKEGEGSGSGSGSGSGPLVPVSSSPSTPTTEIRKSVGAPEKGSTSADLTMSFSSVEIATIPAPPHLSDGGSLHSYPPRVIAQQMTFMDVALYAQIQPEEMLLSNWTKPNKEQVAPTLTHLARQFNMWSGMVATDIILGNSLSDQVAMVKFYIRVMNHLLQMNNFQSLMAIASGLNCSSVSRLKGIWSKVPPRYQELLANTDRVMSPLGNYKYYRQLLAENRDKNPIVPYLVVFLRDLTFINDGNRETLSSEVTSIMDTPKELPNFEKMVLLGQQILELEAYRKVPYDIEENPTVINLLKNARYMDEDTLHRRSLEQEPIHGLNSEEDEKTSEVIVKNPLVALKTISKDFKAVKDSEQSNISGTDTLSESDESPLSLTT